MIKFPSGGILLQDASELPPVPSHIPHLFADFETSSGDPRKTSVNPWRDCRVIGAAVSFGREDPVWFVPRHLLATGWWAQVARSATLWANHNVKYDAHVSANDLGVVYQNALRCTLTGWKLLDSDRAYRGGYGLDVLARTELGLDIDEFGWRMQPYLKHSKDYGDVPLDVLAEYACMDVTANKLVDRAIDERMPEESMDVWRTEQQVTSLLVRMERAGVRVDPTMLKRVQLETICRMLKLDEELERLVGRSFNPVSGDDVFDVLCNQYGLPVLGWTEGSEDKLPGPSFDKEAMSKYLVHPDAPLEIVERIAEYRKLSTFDGLFLKKYDELNVDGVMHPTYNQCIRTGRLSCSDPNMQQLNKGAKRLIIPPPGYGIVSADYSQIEFRFIVHYLQNRACIESYRRDPWTDFHQWVADMVPTQRKPAKTINFMMGYGGGKKKTIQVLGVNKEVVGEVIERVKASGIREEAMQSAIAAACEQRARAVYDKYHATLPELKPTSRQAGAVCFKRGYVRNHYGRRRHLPAQFAHRAFNSACQSGAGDMIKERMVALEEEVPELTQIAQVHDNVVGIAPLEVLERDDSLLRRVCDVMNRPARPLSVPVRTSIGWSPVSWYEAQSEEKEQKYA